MRNSLDMFDGRHRRVMILGALASALCGCSAPRAEAQQKQPQGASVSTISGITLERNCFGCPTGSTLVLRRDGSATYTQTGSARSGTADKTSRGTIRAEDFDKLARVVAAQGFFDLNDTYEDPSIRDGSWSTTSVTRDGQDKRVFSRQDAGPPSLKAVEAAIEAARAQIKFTPPTQ